MTLGKQISRLRAAKGQSQEDLANDLQVSRQSISKWETDTSVSELDKLLRLSEVFGVTLDELVKGPAEDAAQTLPARPVPTDNSGQPSASTVGVTQTVLGIVLICFGFLCFVLSLLFLNWIYSFETSIPLFLCGFLCLKTKRRTGLWCGWVWFIAIMQYLYAGTTIQWTLIFRTIGFLPEWNYMRLFWAWIMFFVILLMIVCTLRSFRHLTITPTRMTVCLLVLGWLVWLTIPYLMDAVLFHPWLTAINAGPQSSNYFPCETVHGIFAQLRPLKRSAGLLPGSPPGMESRPLSLICHHSSQIRKDF